MGPLGALQNYIFLQKLVFTPLLAKIKYNIQSLPVQFLMSVQEFQQLVRFFYHFHVYIQ